MKMCEMVIQVRERPHGWMEERKRVICIVGDCCLCVSDRIAFLRFVCYEQCVVVSSVKKVGMINVSRSVVKMQVFGIWKTCEANMTCYIRVFRMCLMNKAHTHKQYTQNIYWI